MNFQSFILARDARPYHRGMDLSRHNLPACGHHPTGSAKSSHPMPARPGLGRPFRAGFVAGVAIPGRCPGLPSGTRRWRSGLAMVSITKGAIHPAAQGNALGESVPFIQALQGRTNLCPPNPAVDIFQTRQPLLPLLGERAGVRAGFPTHFDFAFRCI